MKRAYRQPKRQIVVMTLALLVAAASVLPQRAQAAPLPQAYTYAECSRMDEAAVQSEMAALAHTVLVEGSSGLEIPALVETTWRTLGADVTFDAAVEAGITRVQSERGYWERFWSGWSADKAEEFAGQVARYAFEDVALQAKLDEISTAIANSLVLELEAAAARSASSALLCLQTYVGEQYSTTLFSAFQESVSQEFADDLDLSQSGSIEISPLEMHTKGLTGVGVIVATQITRRIAQTLAQKITGRLAGKIAGRVLGRLGSSVIPYIGWAVGVGLLVWDLVEGSQGALPTIREALQAEEVKQEMRAEMSAAVADSVAAEVETLAATMAATLVGQWQLFCANHGAVCELAAESSSFRRMLDNLAVTDLARLVQLVDFFWTTATPENDSMAGKEATVAALNDGTLAALMAAPPVADVILAQTNSAAITLAWVDLAGTEIDRVVELELYETIDPLQISQLSLATLLSIGDNAIIHKLRGLPIEQLLELLALPAPELAQLAAVATPDELRWLAGHLAALSEKEAIAVAHALARGETTIALLQAPPAAQMPPAQQAASTGGMARSEEPDVTKSPPTENPPAAALWVEWLPWANNGVAVAAGIVALLLVAVGLVLALRRELVDPPE